MVCEFDKFGIIVLGIVWDLVYGVMGIEYFFFGVLSWGCFLLLKFRWVVDERRKV